MLAGHPVLDHPTMKHPLSLPLFVLHRFLPRQELKHVFVAPGRYPTMTNPYSSLPPQPLPMISPRMLLAILYSL